MKKQVKFITGNWCGSNMSHICHNCSLPSFGYDCPVMCGIQSGECIKVEDSYFGQLVSIVAYGCGIAATYKSLDEVMKIAKSCQYNMGR